MKRLLVCAAFTMVPAFAAQTFAAAPSGQTDVQRGEAERMEISELEAHGAARSVVQERKLLAKPDDTAERLKAAEAYMLEAQDSPSKLDMAAEHIDRILESNPNSAPALMLAGRIAILRQQPVVAQMRYQAAIAADPSNAAAFLALGETWSRLGNDEQASRAFGEYRRLSGMPAIETRSTAPPAMPGQAPPRIIGPGRDVKPAPRTGRR